MPGWELVWGTAVLWHTQQRSLRRGAGPGAVSQGQRPLALSPDASGLRAGFKKPALTFPFCHGHCGWLGRLCSARGFPATQVSSRRHAAGTVLIRALTLVQVKAMFTGSAVRKPLWEGRGVL